MVTGTVCPSAWSSLQDTKGQLPAVLLPPAPHPWCRNQIQGSSCCSPHPFLFQAMPLLRTQNCHLYLSPSTAGTLPAWLSLHVDTLIHRAPDSTRRQCASWFIYCFAFQWFLRGSGDSIVFLLLYYFDDIQHNWFFYFRKKIPDCVWPRLGHGGLSLQHTGSLLQPAGFSLAVACGILVPWPRIKCAPPALEVWSLNHWSARKVSPATWKPEITLKDFSLVFLGWTLHG